MKRIEQQHQLLKCALASVLLLTGLVDGHIPDRCRFKTGFDCFTDPKCLWERPNDSFSPIEDALLEDIKTRFCPEMAQALTAAHDDGTLDTFFTSDVMCPIFCGAYTVADCEAYVSTDSPSSAGKDAVDDLSLRRKLKEHFNSGDPTLTRRMLLSTPDQLSLQEFFQKALVCQMCLDCYRNPQNIAKEIGVFANLHQEALQDVCETSFAAESGECYSRCDPERLEPHDCHKEEQYCRCYDSAAENASDSDAKDILCPYTADITAEEISRTCEKFIDVKSRFQNEIISNPQAACRGLCPLNGVCESGFTMLAGLENLSESTGQSAAFHTNETSAFMHFPTSGEIAETGDYSALGVTSSTDSAMLTHLVETGAFGKKPTGEVIGALNCALCEECKEKTNIYTKLSSVDDCEAYVTSLLSECDTEPPHPPALPITSFCEKECVPIADAKICTTLIDEIDCHNEPACRWVGNTDDVAGRYLEKEVMHAMQTSTCPKLDELIHAADTTTKPDDLCRQMFDCDNLDMMLCSLFAGEPVTQAESVSGGRRLLNLAPHIHIHLNKLNLTRATFGRKLLQMSSAEWLESATIDEIGLGVANCLICSQTCDNPQSLSQLKEISTALPVGAFNELCQSAIINDMEPEGQCQPICSTIPAENCAKYAQHCSCSYYSDEQDGVDVQSGYESGPMSDEGWCMESRHALYDPCYLNPDDTCSKNCVKISSWEESREEFQQHHAYLVPITVKNITTFIAEYSQKERESLTSQTVCVVTGWCSTDMFCKPAASLKCAGSCYCQYLPAAHQLTQYVSTADSNQLSNERLGSLVKELIDAHYGQGICVHNCEQSLNKETCIANPWCLWEQIYHDPMDPEDGGGQANYDCHCLTRSDNSFRCNFANGQCNSGCKLDADLLFRKNIEAEAVAVELLSAVGNMTYHNASAELTTWKICQSLEACACRDVLADDVCHECKECSEAGVTRQIYDYLSEAKYDSVKSFESDAFDASSLRSLILEFAVRFLRTEICYAPACRENTEPDNCPSEHCDWHCGRFYDDDIHGDIYSDEDAISVTGIGTSKHCSCQPVLDNRLQCIYLSENDKCGPKCSEAPHSRQWDQVYAEHYKRNLAYVSMILSGYKLAAADRPAFWVKKLTEHHICTWIGDCSSPTNCLDTREMVEDVTSASEECQRCRNCAESGPVGKILNLFKTRREDAWKDELQKIADVYAKSEASQETCHPSTCDSRHESIEMCMADDRCFWSCHDDAISASLHDDSDEAAQDGCTEFMMNWSQYINNPTRYCKSQTGTASALHNLGIIAAMSCLDISLDRCMETMQLLKDISAAGHFATMKSRLKLCNMFQQLPTIEIIKERIGFLFCDSSQQCCGETDAFADSGVTLTEDRCRRLDGCEFRSECVPMVDHCFEEIIKASRSAIDGTRATCGNGCVFVESSSLQSVETAHGRGFCVDLMAKETCRISALFGCTDSECIEKPVCSPQLNRDYGCLGGDACCVSTTDGHITQQQCPVPNCQLSKRCVMDIDPCGYFTNEWDCNYQKNCLFVPLKNPYDRSAGKCISKKNRCEQLSATKCREAKNCMLIDSCETRVCDAEDHCCMLSSRECRADVACSYKGQCKRRKEFDLCAYYESQDTCPEKNGLCVWDKEAQQCQTTDDLCATMRDKRECAFDDHCVFEESCVDACASCATCVDNFSNLDSDISISEIKQAFVQLCVMNGYGLFQCFATSNGIGKSRRHWAQRPGALCLSLRACTDECEEPTTGAAISRCSKTGWDDGGSADEAEDPCSQCTADEICRQSLSSSESIVCQCNHRTGFDTCKVLGTCVDKCSLYEKRIEAHNSNVQACDATSDCDADFSCDLDATARIMSCREGSVEIVKSQGLCLPNAPMIASAKLADDGRMITVVLNVPAKRDQFMCNKVVDAETDGLLGKALCIVNGLTMEIYLRRGAKVVAGDVLSLANDQTRLQDAVSRIAFVNDAIDIAVEPCEECVRPMVQVNYPDKISTGCISMLPPKVTIDGSLTTDSTGREISCVWSAGVDGDVEKCYRDSATSNDYTACDNLRLRLEEETSPVLEFSADFISKLASLPGFYNMRLTCSNFLQKSDYKDIEIEIIADPLPLISAPEEVYFHKSQGVLIPAAISQDSICPGDVVVYNWTSPSLDIVGGYSDTKDFRMTGAVGTFSETSYLLNLEASLIKSDGTPRSETAHGQVIIYPKRSPVQSAISGMSGDVILTKDIILATKCTDPDDPEDIESGFVHDYFCSRGYEGSEELTLDDSSTRPCEELGTVSDGKIILSRDSLVVDVWYIYSFTCTKDTREHTSTIEFRPRSAEREIPTGQVVQLCGGDCPDAHDPNRNLLLAVVDLSYSDTTIEWICSEPLNEDDVREGVFDQRRLTIFSRSLPGVNSLECTARLKRGDETGEARITVPINSKPFCARETSCAEAELVSETNEFPISKFKLSALSFADDQEESLQFGFGCFDLKGKRKNFLKGPQPHHEIGGLTVGTHTCFVSAIDKYGSETYENVTLEVTEPVEGLTEAMVETVTGAVDTAVASKDIHAVLTAVKTAAQIANTLQLSAEWSFIEDHAMGSEISLESPSALVPDGSDSQRRRRLLSTGTTMDVESLVDSILVTLGDFTLFDAEAFKPAATQLAELVADVAYDTVLAVAEKMNAGLIASFRDLVSYSPEEASQLVEDIAAVLGQLITKWEDDFSALTAMQVYCSLVEKSTDLMCMTVALGESITLDSSGGVSISCLKEDAADLSGAVRTFGDISVIFDNNFATDCGDQCPAVIEIHTATTDNMDLHIGYLDSLVPLVGASEIETLSSVVYITAADLETDEFCIEDGCELILTIPVASYNTSKTTACLRVSDGTTEGLDSVSGIYLIEGSYSEADNTVQCAISSLGEIFVVDFITLDVQSTILTVSLTDEAAGTIVNGQDGNSSAEIIEAELRFVDLDYAAYASDLAANNDLKILIAYQLTESNTISGAQYSVSELREGSVIAIVEILLPNSTSQDEIDTLLSMYEQSPEKLFDSTFTAAYGTPTVTILSAPGYSTEEIPSGNADDDDDDGVNVTAIAVPVTIAVILIIGGVAFLIIRAHRSQRRGQDIRNEL